MLEIETGEARMIVGQIPVRTDFLLGIVEAKVRTAHILIPRPSPLLH